MLEFQDVLLSLPTLGPDQAASLLRSARGTDDLGLGLVHYVLWPKAQRQLKWLLQTHGQRLAGAQDPWGKTILHHLACLSNSSLFEECSALCPALLQVTDNVWRTPLHTLLYRGHLECAVRVILKTQAPLQQFDLTHECLSSLLQKEERGLRTLLWTCVEKANFQEAEQLLRLVTKLFDKPLELSHLGLSVLHDMLRTGSLVSVNYLIARQPELLSPPPVTRKTRFPVVWNPPLHYLCRVKAGEQEAKLRALLGVCQLEADTQGHSPLLYLLANRSLPPGRRLQLLRLIKEDKGKEAVRAALLPELSTALCACAGAPDLLAEVLDLTGQEPDCEVVRTMISAGDSRGLSLVQERGAPLIQGDKAAAFFLGTRSPDGEIRVKTLAWARARHLAYLQQTLLSAIETEVNEQLGTKFGGFSFTQLRRSLSLQSDLDLIRLCSVLADDFEETPNVVAEVLKTAQPAGLMSEVVLAACMLALRRGKLEVVTPLLSLSKAKEALETQVRGKGLFLHIKSYWTVTETTLTALAELSSCGVRFRHLEERRAHPKTRRSDPELLRLWRRGLLSLKASKFEVLARLLHTSPEDVLHRALAYFRKHVRKLEANALPALFLTLREAFRGRDSAGASQILLDWAKICGDSDDPLRIPSPKSLIALLTHASALAKVSSTQVCVGPYVKRHLRRVLLDSVPNAVSLELWKPWERHFVSLCDKKEEAAEELLAEAPTEVFISLYNALSNDLRNDKRLSFGLFTLELLEQRQHLELLKPVFESVAPLARRSADRCSGSEGWVRAVAGWANVQDLLTVSGLDLSWTTLLDTASEDTLLALFRRQPLQEDCKPLAVLRSVRRRCLWRLLRELCNRELQPQLRRLAQEELLLHLDSTELESAFAWLLPHLCLRRLALEASSEVLETVVLRLDHYTCGRTYNIPNFVTVFAGLSVADKFERSTEQLALAPFTAKMLAFGVPQQALEAGLPNLIRWQRSQDFVLTLLKLSTPDYALLWRAVRQAALRPGADLQELEVMARALVQGCRDADVLVTIQKESLETGLEVEVPLPRALSGKELASLLGKVGAGLRRFGDSQRLRARARVCLERVAALCPAPLSAATAKKVGERLARADLAELVPALGPLLPSEVWAEVCKAEVKRGHTAHVRELLRLFTPSPELLLTASKAPNAEELVALFATLPLPVLIQQRVLQQGRLEVLRQLFHELSREQALWLLFSNSAPALIAYRPQLEPHLDSLVREIPVLLQKRLFVSLSFLLDNTHNDANLRSALLQDRKALGNVYGLAPTACVLKVKSLLGEELWCNVLMQPEEGELCVLHNILGVPISRLDYGLFQSLEVPPIWELPILVDCCSPHPLLSRLPEDFRASYDAQYQARSLYKAERLNLLDEAPVYFFMSHVLVLKMIDAAFSVQDHERKLLQLHDVVCRLQFLAALNYPLSYELLAEAARQGREDVVLFLLESQYEFPPKLSLVISSYREDGVTLPQAFLALLARTFQCGHRLKQLFGTVEAESLLSGQGLPRCLWVVAHTHADLLLGGRTSPLLQLLLTGQAALFILLVELLTSLDDLSQTRLAALLGTIDASALQGIPASAVRLELTRRNLLPVSTLPSALESLGDPHQEGFMDALFLAFSHAEELRVNIASLKQTLPSLAESSAQLPFEFFQALFNQCEVAASHFSVAVEPQVWSSFKAKQRPWTGLYLAAQFCGAAGLLGLSLSHSASQENLHFRVGFEPPHSERSAQGYSIYVKPAWKHRSSEPFACDLELIYSLPQTYPLTELQDRIRQFSMTLNSSQAVSFVSVTLSCALDLEDFEVLRRHLLQEPQSDICGLQALETRLASYVAAEEDYFQLAMSSLQLESEDIQIVRSSLAPLENVQDTCSLVNQLLNPLTHMQVALDLVCVPWPRFAETPGCRVSVKGDSVVWDFAELRELRLLQVRSAFHKTGLFESPVARYVRVSLDAETLLKLQGGNAEEVASRLVPLQLWFELEQLFGFFADMQGVLVVPREGSGSLEFSRMGSVLLVHASCRAQQIWAPGTLGVKALTVWTPAETWERCVVASRLLASGDLERGKSYEWLDFFEYLESLLKPVDRFFRSGSRFLVVSELDRDQIKAMINSRYPALCRPDLKTLEPLHRDWEACQQLLPEVRQAVTVFLQSFGLQATENLERLGEEQLQLLRELGEVADDKHNMVLYRLIWTQGRLALDMDYFTFEAEKLPYQLTSLRRDLTLLEPDLALVSFQTAFQAHHGAQLGISVVLAESLQAELRSAPDPLYQATRCSLRLLLCELQTALIRTVTFIDMQQHLRLPELPKIQQPSSLTVNVALCLQSLAVVLIERNPVCAFDAESKTLRVGVETGMEALFLELRRVVAGQWGEMAGVEGLALRAAEQLLKDRLALAALALDTKAGRLDLQQGPGAPFKAHLKDKELTLTVAAQHSQATFLPQVSDLVFALNPQSASRLLRSFASSERFLTALQVLGSSEQAEAEADLQYFARRRPTPPRHLASFSMENVEELLPAWVGPCREKERIAETDGLEVRFNDLAMLGYEPEEHKEEDSLLSEHAPSVSEESFCVSHPLEVTAPEEVHRTARVVPAMMEEKPFLGQEMSGSHSTALPLFPRLLEESKRPYPQEVSLAAEELGSLTTLLVSPTLEALSLKVKGEASSFQLHSPTHLREFHLIQSSKAATVASAILQMSPDLETVELNSCLDDSSFPLVAQVLIQLRKLQHLSLQENGLTAGSVPSIVAVLQACPQVVISLQGNRLGPGLRQYRQRLELGGNRCECCSLL